MWGLPVGQCVLRKWVVGGGRLYGYFGEQGPPVGVQECLEGFHLECAEYLSRQFVPKWNNPNGTFYSASASRDRVGCVNSIFKTAG